MKGNIAEDKIKMQVLSIMSMITKNDLNLGNTNYEELSFKHEAKKRFEKCQKTFKYTKEYVTILNEEGSKEVILVTGFKASAKTGQVED